MKKREIFTVRNRTNRKHDEGWTFIETLIVMAIVLILTASVGFSAVKQIDKARIVTARSQIETFCLALDSYYIDMGEYPSMQQGLDALWTKPDGIKKGFTWNGPYISKPVPADPWGNDYVYKQPGDNGYPFEVFSCGKDGLEGGDGNDADISSAE